MLLPLLCFQNGIVQLSPTPYQIRMEFHERLASFKSDAAVRNRFRVAWTTNKLERFKSTRKSGRQTKALSHKMSVLQLSILLACLVGCIHSTLAASNFFFEKGSQIDHVNARLGTDVTINCTTNYDDANVTLESEQGRSDMIAKEEGRLSRKESVFTIHNIIVQDAGKYTCRATATDGQTITRVVLLMIDTRHPAITIIPFQSKEILTGSTTAYTCEGTMASSKVTTLTWYKIEKITADGHEIRKIAMPDAVDVSIKLSYGRDRIIRSVLTFTNAIHSHSGEYRCELSLGDLLLDQSVQLDVLDPEPAQITDYSAHDITIMKGDHARLLCVARGFPHPTITWKKDGRRIQVCLSHLPCRETDRYILWPNSLMIKDARYPDDDGVFSCHAKNDFGDDSISIVVVVPTPPVLKKSVITLYTWSPKQFWPIEIPCNLAQGSPPPTFSWFVRVCWQFCSNWESITRKNVFKVNPPMSTPALGSTLTIPSAKIPQSLEFNCTVVNKEGSDSMVFQVHQRRAYR